MRYGSSLSTAEDPPSPKKVKFVKEKLHQDFGFLNSMASLASDILNNADCLYLPDPVVEDETSD
jgi:hypothetical protein